MYDAPVQQTRTRKTRVRRGVSRRSGPLRTLAGTAIYGDVRRMEKRSDLMTFFPMHFNIEGRARGGWALAA
jgi:hypothetical protein